MNLLKGLAVAASVAALGVTAAVVAHATPVAAPGEPHPHRHHRHEVTVMARNIFLGSELESIFAATTPPALFAAVGAAWAQVQANDFPARAQALADEIAASRPDLVGLQEAMLYRTDVPPDGPASPAETPAYDFLELLLAALAERGLEYEAVSSFTGTDAELPAGLPPTMDVRITDRVVVLARTGGPGPRPKLSNPQSGTYAAALTVPTVAGPVTLPRGWASVDVKLRGRTFRFVTTHLEAFTPLVRNPQAAELVAGPAAAEMPVVLVGDMNSGPGADPVAYGVLQSAGFADAWPAAAGIGLTCCHAVDLRNPDPTLRNRIDLVLTKGGFHTVEAEVVGEEPADRTAGGLWPSDHAGVVATLRLS